MFPANWDLSGLGAVRFVLSWENPFISGPTDRYLSVEVAAPREWPHWEMLKNALRPKLVPRGFIDVYEPGEPDPNSLFWTYIPFDHFMSETGLDTSKYVIAIKDAVRVLCDVRPAIDEFLAKYQSAGHAPQETADLRVIAFLDTETTGLESSSEVVELAILTACDPMTGEVLGVLEQYVGHREPGMAVPELARASGLTSNFCGVSRSTRNA